MDVEVTGTWSFLKQTGTNSLTFSATVFDIFDLPTGTVSIKGNTINFYNV